MANPYFRFKKFTVWHDRCAMKVGTDAVLLGSWMRVEGAQHLLDVGCGCGLIALMAAQRCPEGKIIAVEIDSEAAQQAKENVKSSPWADRIQVIQEDFNTFTYKDKFDVIFSNPPYFVDSLKCPNKERNTARHTDTLDFHTLMRQAKELLTPNGELSVVIPMDASAILKAEAISQSLYLSRETHVYTKEGIAAKRVLLAFKKEMPSSTVIPQQLILEIQPKVYSDEFRNMIADFYL